MCLYVILQNGASTEHRRSAPPTFTGRQREGECEWPQGKASVKRKVKEGVRGGNTVTKVDD